MIVSVPAFADWRELLGKVEAVSVVTHTPAHFEIAAEFLKAGAHVLVEKPMTETLEQARELIALAGAHRRVLQVGHLERFNAAILAAETKLRAPRFLECHRLAPFRERNLFFGGCQAVERDAGGVLSGGGDPRRGGAVVVTPR